jgi:hypothetical protein
MSRAVRIAVVLVALVCAAGAGGLVVLALGDERDAPRAAPAARTSAPAARDVDDAPLGEREAARVEAAALRATGGGRVVEMDRSDDPGERYEVEVVRAGREIDVALDDRLRRVPNVRYDGSGGERAED